MRNTADYHVWDWARLTVVMKMLIHRHGTQAHLADAVDVTQGYISKLRYGRPEGVGRETLRKLLRVATREERTLLDGAFASPAARALYRRYVGWLKRELRAYGFALQDSALTGTASGEADWTPPPSLAPRRPLPKVSAQNILPHLLSLARQRHPALFRKALASVEGRWADTPDGRWRVYLALLRVAAPLAAGWQRGSVERSYTELEEAGELEDYLMHALKAQEILLRRDTALVRARQQAGTLEELAGTTYTKVRPSPPAKRRRRGPRHASGGRSSGRIRRGVTPSRRKEPAPR